MISVWSLFSSTLWFLLAFLLLFLLRGHTDFLMRHGTTAWSIAVVLTIVRLLLPLDVSYMVILRSYTVLPSLDDMLWYEPWPGISIKLVLASLWAVGAMVGLILIACGILRDRRRLGKLPVVPLTPQVQAAIQTCGMDADMIRVAPMLSTPIATGFFRPTVYLPDMEYPQADLVWILKHEMSHIAGRDAWWRLGFLLFRCLFWWNPLVHLAQKSVDDILELRCDKTVLHGVDEAQRLAYGEALCRAAQQTYEGAPSFVGAGTFVHPRKMESLILRVRIALDEPRRRDPGAILVLILSVALFMTSYVFILQPARLAPDTEDGVTSYGISTQTSYLKQLPSGDYEFWCDGEFFGTVHADDLQHEMYQGLEVLE